MAALRLPTDPTDVSAITQQRGGAAPPLPRWILKVSKVATSWNTSPLRRGRHVLGLQGSLLRLRHDGPLVSKASVRLEERMTLVVDHRLLWGTPASVLDHPLYTEPPSWCA